MSTFRYEDILRAMDLIREPRPLFDMALIPPQGNGSPLYLAIDPASKDAEATAFGQVTKYGLGAIKIFESPHAKRPARIHKKRRWMSERYHQRIQKKWNKRFGFEPCAYLIDTKAITDLLRGFVDRSFDIRDSR